MVVIMVKQLTPTYRVPKTNRQGYDLVLSAFGGNVSKMADTLRVSRQILYVWREKGIPTKRVREISTITGLPPEHIKPNPY